MHTELSVSRLIEELKASNPAAAQSLWDAYFQRLVGVASAYLRSRGLHFDEESVAGSALATFICRAREGRFPDLQDREGLWGLLFVLTVRKVIKRLRRRSRRPEVSFSDLGDLASAELESIIGSGPDPAVINGLWTELMDGLDERRRHVARLKLEGYRNNEIARRLALAEVTVQRDLRKIRENWTKADKEQVGLAETSAEGLRDDRSPDDS
jgi:DNA-directed RNA polymerase specialized sigma24 family protein